MSEDNAEEPQARRSTRERKKVVKFAPGDTKMRVSSDGLADDEPEDGQDDSDEDNSASFKGKTAATKAGKRNIPQQRRKASKATGDALDGDTTISEDNELFQAVRNAGSALELTVEEWIAGYSTAQAASQSDDDVEQSKGPALAEMLNFVLRCCGCNASIDQYEAVDVNNYKSKQEDILQEFQQDANSIYPLTIKTKPPQRFRKSLHEFFDRLVRHTHTSNVLYDEYFYPALNAWIATASSSKVRPFRHTATVISLELVTAMCRVSADAAKELASLNRQKEAEVKKARADQSRLKTLQSSVAETHQKKEALEQKMNEIFTSVYVHRYKDSEPTIRAECVRALGDWMDLYPDYYLEGTHLRYIGWQLTDSHKEVRIESIKALAHLYDKADAFGALQTFTERFKSRFVEMAAGEPDINIRRTAISVVEAIDKHGLLEDDQRQQLAKLIFHNEARVRQAVAPAFLAMISETVDQNTEGQQIESSERLHLWFKELAAALHTHGTALGAEAVEESDPNHAAQFLPVEIEHSRLSFVIDALWSVSDDIQDWEALAEFLLLDHSGDKQTKGKGRADELEEASKLSHEEETVLVELLVAAIAKRKQELDLSNQASKKAGTSETANEQVTRTMIKLLPLLLAKYQESAENLHSLLGVPLLMNLELYLDMRMVAAYEELWDIYTTQFLRQKDALNISTCASVVRCFTSCAVLGESNSTKLSQLLKTLGDNVRDAVVGVELESTMLDDDQIEQFTAFAARMDFLLQSVDCTSAIDDNGGMIYTSLWEIADAFAERGRLGIASEEKLVMHSLSTLHTHCMRRLVALGQTLDPHDSAVGTFIDLRDKCSERLMSLAIATGSNALDGVKRVAFQKLVQIYTLAKLMGEKRTIINDDHEDAVLDLECPEELQYRCLGFIQGEIERYVETHIEVVQVDDTNGDDNENSQSDDGMGSSGRPKGEKGNRNEEIRNSASPADEAELLASVASFAKGICAAVFSLHHAAPLLAQQGRFGAFYDNCIQPLFFDLKEEALAEDGDGQLVVRTIGDALFESLDLFVDHQSTEDTFMAIGRSFASTLRAHGPKLSIIARFGDQNLINLHKTLLSRLLRLVGNFEDTDRLQKSERALICFKALSLMLVGVTASEAQAIRDHVDKEMSNLKLDDKTDRWSPKETYYRKLTNAVSKADGTRPAKRARGKRHAEADDSQSDDDAPARPKKTAAKAKAQPTRTRQPRASEKSINYADIENEQEGESNSLLVLPNGNAAARSKPKQKKTAAKSLPENAQRNTGNDESEQVGMLRVTPRKRPREATGSDEEQEGNSPERERSATLDPDEDQLENQLTSLSPTRPRPPASQESQLSVSHFKKKRRRV